MFARQALYHFFVLRIFEMIEFLELFARDWLPTVILLIFAS
jgi:hypothetical protein